MTTTAVISIFCKDRPGVFADLTDTLAFMGANLHDMSASQLGEGVILIGVSVWSREVPVDEIERRIRELPGLDDAQVHINAYPYRDYTTELVTHVVRLSTVVDKPGDLAALCAVFAEYRANLMRAHARRLLTDKGWEYRIVMEATVPRLAATSCMAGLEYTAQRLGYDCDWEIRGAEEENDMGTEV